jgi:hypothetical protein
MKLMKNLLFCFLLMLGFAAIANAEDVIYLKDGSVVHGTIIKRFPDTGSIKVRKHSGKEVVYKKKQVLRVEVVNSESHAATHSSTMSEAPKKHHHHEEYTGGTTNGVNNIGRPGYFFSDTAYTPNKGQIEGAAGAAFYSVGSQLVIPVGAAYGITDQIQVHASTNFYTGGGVSGLGNIVVGGKYKFNIAVEHLTIAAGLDLSDGPLTGSGYSSFNFDPYGIATYNFADGLQLNGQLGIMILGGYNYTYTATRIIATPPYYQTYQATTSVGGGSYVQLNAGASYPLGDKLTGIAELDINGQGSGATPLIVGIRTGHDVQLQAFGGLDLAGTVGVMIGGNVALVSE